MKHSRDVKKNTQSTCIIPDSIIHTFTLETHVFSLYFLLPTNVSLQIREEIEQYGIKIYQFPDCDSDEDEEFKQQDLELKVRAGAVRWLC